MSETRQTTWFETVCACVAIVAVMAALTAPCWVPAVVFTAWPNNGITLIKVEVGE